MAVGRVGPIRVLHVDDEPEFADLTAQILEREFDHLSVETATEASDGLAKLASDDVDCLVSDFDMPGQNGIELLESVRADLPEIPFILFTGKGSEEIASEAISAGVTDYLQKGGGTEQFLVLGNRIENAVDRYRAEKLADRAFQAMDSSSEGIALLNENGEFVHVNDMYGEILGYDRSDLVGEHWETTYPEGQAQRVYDEILETVQEAGHWAGETVYRRADGSRILVDHEIAYSEEGTMICLVRNLTDEMLREKQARRDRKRLDLFVEAVEDYAIFMLDHNGYVTTWNEGANRLEGYTKDEILGKHVSTFYTESQREQGLPENLLARALADGSAEHRGPRVRKDGTTFLAHVVITAVYDEDGNHRGFGKVTRDLTAADG